jgi:hypothetical protein
MIPAIVMLRIVFITAMVNIVFLLLILFTCRCMNMWKITSPLNKFSWFKQVFKWHCYLWYIFLPSLIIHIVFAIWVLGVPF